MPESPESPELTTAASSGPSSDYWDGARDGRLLLQRCVGCGRVRHYPRPLCPGCYSFDVEVFPASGHGSVHSWTVTHQAFDPSVAGEVPYVVVTVDLPEGVRVLGRLVSAGPPQLDMPVRIGFRPGPDGTPVLEVTVVRSGGES
ncbi:MAG: Zn-ribbon domain-containing OB-fold protein [Acidimicrobiales bacterium]